MTEEFDYDSLWDEQEKIKEKKIQTEIVANLPKGKPRKGVNVTSRLRVKR